MTVTNSESREQHHRLKDGDRVFIVGKGHPWKGKAGNLIAYEKYGLGWMGWRVELDDPFGQECYARTEDLQYAG